jgi:hypothetical protein
MNILRRMTVRAKEKIRGGMGATPNEVEKFLPVITKSDELVNNSISHQARYSMGVWLLWSFAAFPEVRFAW